MKDRLLAAKKRTVLLISLFGFVGLSMSSEARARPTTAVSISTDTVPAGGGRRQGRRHRVAKGKKKHANKIGASEVATTGKARSPRHGRVRQDKAACVAAFDKAKEIAADSHFRSANEWFALCARPSCSRPLRQKCAAVHERIAALIPSVVPEVTGVPGPSRQEVEVRIDGEMLTSNLDGTAIEVDPGDHEFTFAKDGEVFAKRSFAVEKGQHRQVVSVAYPAQKNRRVDLSAVPIAEEEAEAPVGGKADKVEAAAVTETAAEKESGEEEKTPAPSVVRRDRSRRASVETDPKTGAPWSAYALAGVGLLGVGGYGVFNLKGSADNDALAALCKPNCSATSVRHVRNLYLAADISLGIGVAALLGSTYLFLRSNGGDEETSGSRTGHISGLSVEPTRSGALATVGGTF